MSDLTERARALLNAATPGPWMPSIDGGRVGGDTLDEWAEFGVDFGDGHPAVVIGDNGVGRRTAEFIANAPTLVADLLAEIERRDRRDAFIPDAVRLADAAVEVQPLLPDGYGIEVTEDWIAVSAPLGRFGFDVEPIADSEQWRCWWRLTRHGPFASPALAARAALDALGVPAPTTNEGERG